MHIFRDSEKLSRTFWMSW